MRRSVVFALIVTVLTSPLAAQPAERSASEDVPAALAERARNVAERSSPLQEMLVRARTIYIGVDLERRKGDGDIELPPLYRVRHYRYADDTVVTSLVEIESGRLVDQIEVAHAPAPLVEIELAEARRLALRDRRVTAGLGPGFERLTVEPLMVRTSDPRDPWYGQRIVRLLFRAGRNYLSNPIVYVNLTTKAVIVEAAHGRSRGDEE